MSDNNRVLSIRGLTKRFGSLVANDDVSLDLHRGEVIALLGENGAGKSTLVSQLFGHYRPDSGIIEVFGKTLPPGRPDLALKAGVGMVHQHFALADNLTVLDNVLVGTESLWRIGSSRGKAREQLEKLGQQFGLAIQPDALISTLSVGERQRVEILKALYRGAKILILDEPTAVLTPQESDSLFATLRQLIAQGLSLIFISHKLDEVLRVADRVLVLRQGRLVAERNARDSERSELAQLMIGRSVDVIQKTTNTKDKAATQKPLMQLRNVLLNQSATGARQTPIDLTIHAGEIVAIAGVAGNGQKALSSLLMSRPIKPKSGSIETAQGLQLRQIARITADRQGQGVVKQAPVWENAIIEDLDDSRFVKFGLLRSANAQQHAANIIQQFDVRTPSMHTRTGKLSGGNMQKLILGRNLVREPQLIIADQPTWGLDVGAVAFIHQQLLNAAARGAGILLISEDLDEVFALADRIGVMYQYGLVSPRQTHQWTMSSLGLAMAGTSQRAA